MSFGTPSPFPVNRNKMIFPINAIIALVAQFTTLEPGDLIAAGSSSEVLQKQVFRSGEEVNR